jgi:hypothetical protein
LRKLRHPTLALVASGLLACGGGEMATAPGPVATPGPAPVSSGPFDLLFTGLALPHARQGLSVAVIKASDVSVVVSDTQTIGSDGSFRFSWAGILEGGQSYRLDFFADHNGNGRCDPPPTDHSWQASLGTVTGPVSYDFQHNGGFTEVCASFS